MSLIFNLYQKWKEKREQAMRDREDIPDDITTDRYLRSLRRQRRMIDEEFEKERLKKEIHQHYLDKTNKYLWGIKQQKQRTKAMLDTKFDLTNKKGKILNANKKKRYRI